MEVRKWEKEEKMSRRWVWRQEESEQEAEWRSCVLCVWCGSDGAGQMVLMNRIWPSAGSHSAGPLLHPLPPFLHSIIPSLNTSSSLSVKSNNFQRICYINFNFVPLLRPCSCVNFGNKLSALKPNSHVMQPEELIQVITNVFSLTLQLPVRRKNECIYIYCDQPWMSPSPCSSLSHDEDM